MNDDLLVIIGVLLVLLFIMVFIINEINENPNITYSYGKANLDIKRGNN